MITGELSLSLSLGTRPTHFFEHMLSCLLPTSPPKANLSSSILTLPPKQTTTKLQNFPHSLMILPLGVESSAVE